MTDGFDAMHGYYSAMLPELQTYIDELDTKQQALIQTLLNLMERNAKKVETTSPGFEVPEGSFDFIPIGIPDFLGLLIHLDKFLREDSDYACAEARYRSVSFLEVGCGPGRNVLLAKATELLLWKDVSGFDINRTQVEIGQVSMGLENDLFVADAMTFDYSPYDVIFSYRPFSDDDKQIALERYMVTSMRRGAYLLAPLAYDLSDFRELTLRGNGLDIWKKIA